MKNKIKMGVVEVDGVCIGDVIESEDGVVVGFRKVWGVVCRYEGVWRRRLECVIEWCSK